MKKTLLLIIFFSAITLAHKQHVHQYLCQEGYNYLKNYMGNEIPEMRYHLGGGPVGPPWTNGTIQAGAWREDEEDVVYGYYQYAPGDPEGALISITHFWDADDGDFNQNTFQVAWDFAWINFTGTIGPYPNAYEKLQHYAYGYYILYFNMYPYIRVQKSNGQWLQLTPGTPDDVALYYYSLSDLFKNRRLHTCLLGSYKMYNESTGNWEYYDGEVYVTEEFRDKLVWEILGRMCHLIQDMSVPAHAHRDEHGLPPSDQYEDWVAGSQSDRYQYYNSSNIGTNFLDPYISSNPLHFLMYTTQQISDHFGSSGPYEGVGNDNLAGNYLPEEINYLNSLPYSQLGQPTYLSASFSYNELANIRDKTLPQAIKATAGLLYWFAIENGLICNVTLKNSFNSGTILFDSQSNPSGAVKPVLLNENHTLTAVNQIYADRSYIWNNYVQPNISSWQKLDEFGNSVPLYNNLSSTYSLLVTNSDKKSTYIAGLKKNCKIDVDHQTEFNGLQADQLVKYIVEQNSDQITAPVPNPLNPAYNFAGWTDGNGDNPRTITPTDNATYTALYKIPSRSNNQYAFSSNSQKKIVRTSEGILHKVYESMGKVWYEMSTNNGTTWTIQNNGKPLSFNDAKLPAIDFSSTSQTEIIIVWQEKYNDTYKIRLAHYNRPGPNFVFHDVYNDAVYYPTTPYSHDAMPVISWGDNKILVVWKEGGLLFI